MKIDSNDNYGTSVFPLHGEDENSEKHIEDFQKNICKKFNLDVEEFKYLSNLKEHFDKTSSELSDNMFTTRERESPRLQSWDESESCSTF